MHPVDAVQRNYISRIVVHWKLIGARLAVMPQPGQLPDLGPGRTIRVTAEAMDAIGALARGRHGCRRIRVFRINQPFEQAVVVAQLEPCP